MMFSVSYIRIYAINISSQHVLQLTNWNKWSKYIHICIYLCMMHNGTTWMQIKDAGSFVAHYLGPPKPKIAIILNYHRNMASRNI